MIFVITLIWSGAVSAQVECNSGDGETGMDYGGEDIFLLENLCWTGSHTNIGTLTIGPSFTLQAAPGQPLSIEADTIAVWGHLSADESGGEGGAGGDRGQGGFGASSSSGAGNTGTSSADCSENPSITTLNAGGGGGGGGGYGGTGSAGGHGADAADSGCQGGPGGTGGSSWGSTGADSLNMGTGGGGGGGAGGAHFESGEQGGSGGGQLILLARTVEIYSSEDAEGAISADGGTGGRGGTSPDLFHGGGGGGGGSGGSVHLRTTYLLGDGQIRAAGGDGGAGGLGDIRDGLSFSGAGGGGGGGGRVFLEVADTSLWGGMCTISGGLSGSGENTNSGPSPAGSTGDCRIVDTNGAPEANAGGPYVAAEGGDFTLDGSLSTDPDDDILTYLWDLDCNGTVDVEGIAATGSFRDNSVDPYEICLTVDDGEFTHSATTFVTVFDVPPIGVINSPAEPPVEGESFTIDALSSYADGLGTIDDRVQTVEWDWDYDILSGFSPSGDVGMVQELLFEDDGRYFIAIRVTDEDGGQQITVDDIDIINAIPEITSITWPSSAIEGQLWTYQMEVTDQGIHDTFIFEVLTGPVGMTVDEEEGLYSWIPLYTHTLEGEVTARLSVTDNAFGRAIQDILVAVIPADIDDDGMPDGWEAEQEPPFEIGVDDSMEDPDGDGVTNLEEFERGTDPYEFDGPGAPRLASPPLGYEGTYPADLTLSVFAASDPDGSYLTYRMALYDQDPEIELGVAPILEIDGVEADGIIASWQLTPEDGLLDNHRYYWQAWAFDGLVFGPPSELGNFFINSIQDCPTVPELLTPLDGTFVSTLSPVFIVENSIDLDEDPIFYWFVLYTDPELREAVANSDLIVQGEDSTTSWSPSEELEDHVEYYWRAKAIDAEGCESAFSETWSFLTTVGNLPPTAPIIISPEDGEIATNSRPDIVVANADDPDRDFLIYTYEIDTSPTFDSPNYQISEDVPEGLASEGTIWQVTEPLIDNALYYVRVQAHDGTEAGPFGESTFISNYLNDPPTIPIPINPIAGTTIENQRPRLTVENAFDADGETLLYHFQIFVDDQMQTMVTERNDIPENIEQSSWRLNFSLLSGPYWWRARAIDHVGPGEWSDLVMYTITLARPDLDDDTPEDQGSENQPLQAPSDVGCDCTVLRSGQAANIVLSLLVLFGCIGLLTRRHRV